MTRGPIDTRLLRHARGARRGVAALVLLGVGQAAATLLIASALTLLVVSFAQGGGSGPAAALLGGAFAARAALSWGEQVVARRTAARAGDELRRTVLAAALRHGPAWVANHGTGRLVALLTDGIDALRPWFAGYLPALVLGVTLPPCVIVVMAVADPASALITVVTLPLIPAFGVLIGWATRARAQRRWAADARLAGHFLDVVRGLPTLRLFGRAERQVAVVAQMTERHRAATMTVLRLAFLSSTALDLVGTLSVGVVAVQAGLRVAAGDLGLGPALLVILLAPEAFRPVREVAARYHAAADATAVIGDVDAVLTTAPAHNATDPAGFGSAPGVSAAGPSAAGPSAAGPSAAGPSAAGPSAAGLGAAGLGAAGLRVRHPGAAVDALTLPALNVRAGELVALRGPSGSGKTTALRVMAGLQTPVEGHRQVSGPRPLYLPQRPTLPHARTIREALASPAGQGPTAAQDIDRALRTVGLQAEIAALPDGLDTPLGEHGHGVSSGQRQRIALARLLHEARHTPTVLLLDEPTAHLDPDAEALVVAQLRAAAARGCAVLVVAHRPMLLAAADRVVDVGPEAPDGAARPECPAGAARPRAVTPPPHPPAPSPPQSTPPRLQPAQPDPASRPQADAVPYAGRRVRRSWGVVAAIAATTPQDLRGARRVGPRRTLVRDGDPRRDGTAEPRSDGAAPATGGSTRWRGAVAVLLGAGSLACGLVLTGAAGWLLVRASTMPPVLSLSTAVVLVRAGAIARPLLRYLERLMSHDLAFARLGEWRARVYADLVPRVPGVVSHRRGELLTRVVHDVDARVDGLLRGRLPATATLLVVGAAVAVAWLSVPAAGAALLGGLTVAGVLGPVLAGRETRRTDAATARARAALRDAVVETVDGLEELASRGEAAALIVPHRRSGTLQVLEARAARTAGTATAVAHLGWGVGVAGVAAVLGPAVAAGYGAEAAAVLLLGAVVAGESVPALADTAMARRRATAARRRLAAIAAEPVATRQDETAEPATATPATATPATATPATAGPRLAEPAAAGTVTEAQGGTGATRTGAPALVVRGLVAGWDPRRRPALRGVDLVVPAGGRVAVRGPSGGGKSTLAAVLVGLLDPRGGSVTLDGVPLRGVGHRVACLVGDDVDHVFASTVRENLRLARPGAGDDELREVLTRVRLDGWLAGLGDGLGAWLGEGGGTVSGGQRRRLAMARALLADPDLLVLDEPTEGLDGPTATALMADLLAASAGRTVLLLTHRTDGLAHVDTVHDLIDGRLIDGPPTEGAPTEEAPTEEAPDGGRPASARGGQLVHADVAAAEA